MMVPGSDGAKRMEVEKVLDDPPGRLEVMRGIGSADDAAVSSKGVARLCFERCTAGGWTREKWGPSYTKRVLPGDGRKLNIHSSSVDFLGHSGSAMMGYRGSRPEGKIRVRSGGRPSEESF